MRILIIIVALLSLLSVAACGPKESSAAPADGTDGDASSSGSESDAPERRLASSTPEQALDTFLEQLEAGDLEAAAMLVVTPSEERRTTALERNLKQTATLIASGKLEYRWMELKTKGAWTVVVTKLTMTSGATREVRIRDEFMLHERGGWRLAPEAVRGDPVVRERMDDDFRVLFGWYRENQERFQATYGAEAPASD